MIRPTLIRILFLTLLGSVAWPNLATSPANLDAAVAAQEELVTNEPGDPVAWNDLGNLLVVVGRDSEAEECYRQALDLAPDDPAARFNLALLMHQDGRAKEAETELRQLLEMDPRHAWAHYQLGVILDDRKDRDEALDHYARALAYDPSLSFAENNPHIIDNKLFTEALLTSQRYGEAEATRVPRQYGEPERIVQLMLDQRQGEPQKAKGEEAGEAPGPEGKARSTGGSPPQLEDAPGAAPTPEEAGGAARRPGGKATAPAGTTVGGVPDRSAGAPAASGDKHPAQRPGGAPPPPGTARPGSRVDASGRTVPPAATRPTLRSTPPPPPRSSRYIPPSRRSSAQLELELLPAETQERYASVATGPRG